jgi:hypothetical protein
MTFQSDRALAANPNPKRRAVVQASALASMLLLSGLGSTAMAQEGDKRGRGVNVPCCQCIDGKSTTVDISTGTAPWTSTTGAVAVVPSPEAAWASKPPARWIFTGSNAPGLYTYNLVIHVPKDCIIPMEVSFKGVAFGDNNIVVKIDDRQIGTTAVSSGGQANYGFRDPYGVPVSGNLSGGDHVLSVTVRNDEGPTGFLLNGALTIKCSSGPLTKGK